MKKFLTRHTNLFIVLLLALAFFFGTSAFNYKTQFYSQTGETDFVKWGSPDESANYIFTKLFAQTGELIIPEKYNIVTKDIMHPRSIRADYGRLKPMSFLGMVYYYGQLAKYFGYKAIPFLTPFFAALSLVFYYLLVKKVFNKSNALLSTVILAVFPPFVYYTARSMFHNVFFVSLLIISAYFLYLGFYSYSKEKRKEFKDRIYKFFSLKKPKQETLFKSHYRLKFFKPKNVVFSLIGGIFLGIAIGARASELIWIFPAMFLVWLINIRKVNLVSLFFLLLGAVAGLAPILYYNEFLFGSFFFGGYAEMNQSIVNIALAGSDIVKLENVGTAAGRIRDAVFYFGIHPRFSLEMAYKYFVQLFPWVFWPMVFGLLFVLARPAKYKQRVWVWLSSFALISAVLILYYGSWEFHDNPDPNQFTIGNSYTRYWLPVYIMAIPFASLFLLKLTRGLSALLLAWKREKAGLSARRFTYWSLRAAILILISYYSISFVLVNSQDSLVYLAQRQLDARVEQAKILSLTESNSAIITRYHDKLLFPERKVIVGLFDDPAMVGMYANLAQFLPVYYYNFSFPQADFDYLNTRRLKEAGLQIELVEKVTQDFSLYRLLPDQPAAMP